MKFTFRDTGVPVDTAAIHEAFQLASEEAICRGNPDHKPVGFYRASDGFHWTADEWVRRGNTAEFAIKSVRLWIPLCESCAVGFGDPTRRDDWISKAHFQAAFAKWSAFKQGDAEKRIALWTQFTELEAKATRIELMLPKTHK